MSASQDGAVLPPLADIIAFLDATDPETWWAGPTFRSPCGTRHCALSHVFERWGEPGMAEFEDLYSTSYIIGARVNDGPSDRYPQPHPKDRCVAYLRAMERGEEPTTAQQMEADFEASKAREQPDTGRSSHAGR